MRFSENWLRSFVNPPYSRDQLIHALTMAGVEVDCVDEVAPTFGNVVVAEVISIQKHPDADRLTICKVDAGLGNGTLLQIVCGAANVSEGIKVPCALVGACLPGGIVIKQSKLRGVESFGMLCSGQELGLSEKKEGLLTLPGDAPVGMSFRDYYQLEDRIFTLKLTPNRADCLSLYGIAREVAAISDTSLDIPAYDELIKAECTDHLTVNVEVPEACPLYCGRIIRDVTLENPTPLWMVHRLERSGIRSINIVVDILNYVMLEMGQPMHGFDLAKISDQLSGKISVRFARSNESLKLINGENLELKSDMLVIADTKHALALAGIMGGLETSIQSGTTDVFLESAYFSPHVISGKSFKLGFNTDSAYRFERGVDFASTRKALERATQLILELTNGAVAGPITQVEGSLPKRDPVMLRLAKLQHVLGINLSSGQVAGILERLNFNFSEDKGIFHICPPSYRFDLAIEVDFIEEVARIYGYDRIPVNLPKSPVTMLPEPEIAMVSPSRLRNVLALRDYQEVINYAFVDPRWELDFSQNCAPIALKNPIASQMSVMRTTLIGGLVANLQFNISRKQSRVRLFEIGCCFLRGVGGSYEQIEKIAGICYGNSLEEQWGVTSRNVDYFDIKMDIESVCLPQKIVFNKFEHHALHPGKSAQIMIDNNVVGWLGELHPRLQAQYDLPRPAILFELDLNPLVRKHLSSTKVISKFPPVSRDIAIVISEHVTNDQLLKVMKDEQIHIVRDIYLFDYYSGKSLEKGKKSYAYRILLQDNEKTLTDQEVEAAIIKLISALQSKYEAKLRV